MLVKELWWIGGPAGLEHVRKGLLPSVNPQGFDGSEAFAMSLKYLPSAYVLGASDRRPASPGRVYGGYRLGQESHS